MPFNGNTYTLPESPFVVNTTIDPTPVNANFSDIAGALNELLLLNGASTMTGQLVCEVGSAGTPAITFNGDTDTGFYHPSANQVGISLGGVGVLTFTQAGLANLSLTGTTTATGANNFNGNTTVSGTLTLSASSYSVSNGSALVNAIGMNATIQYVIDGGGAVFGSGIKGFIEVPFNCTIKRVTMMADVSGSCVVDIWQAAYASFPPTSGNSITASDHPTLSSQQNSQDSTLSGWTTALVAGDILAFNVISASTLTRVTVSLFVTRTGL